MIRKIWKKTSERKLRLLRRLAIFPSGVMVLGLIYPFSYAIEKLVVGDRFFIEECVNTPDPYRPALVLLFLLALWIASAVPIFAGPIKSAIYVRLVMLAGMILMFLFFPLVALFFVECKNIAHISTVISYAVTISIVSSFVIVCLLKPRLRRVIEINGHAFDFKRGRLALTASLMHVSGKANTRQIAAITVAAGFVGISLAKTLLFQGWALPDFVRKWGDFSLFWAIGWVCIGVYGGGELYVTWLVWVRSRAEGRPMLTAELVDDEVRQIRNRSSMA